LVTCVVTGGASVVTGVAAAGTWGAVFGGFFYSEWSMPGWMGLREYARHRGDTLSAVQKAIATGRVTADAVRRDNEGRCIGIDQERADVQWALLTDPVEALRNGKLRAGAMDESAQMPLADAPAAEKGDNAAALADTKGYLDARTREMEFRAKRSELDYLERVGTLVSADDARGVQIQIYREHRDRLEQLPARVSQRLAAETDPQRIEHALVTEIRTTLSELSAQIAGGPGGREHAPA
jgi:hypothetical protein